MLQIYNEPNSKIIYLFIAKVSFIGPLKLPLVAFFFIAFKLDFFKRFLEAFLGVGLVGVLLFNLLFRK